jgi:amidase
MLGNTALLDVSGDPAISMPFDMVDGLPIGLMMVSKRYDEATVLRVAEGFE